MASNTLAVTIRANTRLVIAWIRLMAITSPLIGRGRAERWAERGAYRLILVKIDSKRWRLGLPYR